MGGRLARLALQYTGDPDLLARVMAGREPVYFSGSGAVLESWQEGPLLIVKRGSFIRIGGGPASYA